MLTLMLPTPSTCCSARASSKRFAANSAFVPSIPANNSANSSPPKRAAVSLSRETLVSVLQFPG